MTLDYLAPYQKQLDLEKLTALVNERESFKQRKGSEIYREALSSLPQIQGDLIDRDDGVVEINCQEKLTAENLNTIETSARQLIPWRKGPFKLFDLEIDAEWRSDFKWKRIDSALGDLNDQLVLDIGASNGFYMFNLLKKNPKLVLGIDPVPHPYFQFRMLNHFLADHRLQFELLGIEHVPHFRELFDTILFMGIIYHHRHPILQLQHIHQALKPGGRVIIETIGIPDSGPYALFPQDRYANMRNVWFVPTSSCLINWAHKAKFDQIEVISDELCTTDEQRLTPWCPPPHQSLEQFLDSHDQSKTIEGYPAPRRIAIVAQKKWRT